MESTQLVPKSKNEVAIMGTPDQVLPTDIKIPYIILGQGLSDAVVSKEVAVGDIFRSSSKEILGNEHNPIDVIFLHYPQAMWVIEFKPKGSERWKYKGMIPRDAKNETLPWYYWADENGVTMDGKTGAEYQEGDKGALPWRRVKLLRVFGVLEKDIRDAAAEMKKAESGDLPDPSKALTPVVFSFRSTSYDAGKDVCTFVSRAQGMKQPPCRYIVQLGVKVDKNDEGTFTIWKAQTGKPKAVPKDLWPMIEEWAALVNKRGNEIKTDDSAIVE